jgi:hypothetical protein
MILGTSKEFPHPTPPSVTGKTLEVLDVVFWMSYTFSLATYFHGLNVRFLLFPPFLFQLGGGYLFGLPVGFVADSIGATIGATAAFILGRTVSRLNTVILWFLLHRCADMHAFFLLNLIIFFSLKRYSNMDG